MEVRKDIKIKLLQHRKTGLYVALSDELDGLVLHAQSAEEIEERLPGVVRDLLAAAGADVHEVTLKRESDPRVPDYVASGFVANASLCDEAA